MIERSQIPGFSLKHALGRGAFGKVYHALWNDAFDCAVKVLDAESIHAGYLTRCLGRLEDRPQHPGIMRVFAGELMAEPPYLSMALLPEDPVTFLRLGGALPSHESWSLIDQLATSLAWLHEQDLVHTGLSGGNVYVVANEQDEPQVIVSDLGQGWLGKGALDRLHKQAPFLSPERWREPDLVLRDAERAKAWDVYAFGVLAWHLLTGYWPRANSLFTSVLNAQDEPLSVDPVAFAKWLEEEPSPVWPTTEEPGDESHRRGVIQRCLAINPAKRPASMQEVASLLQHAREHTEPVSIGESAEPTPVPAVGPEFPEPAAEPERTVALAAAPAPAETLPAPAMIPAAAPLPAPAPIFVEMEMPAPLEDFLDPDAAADSPFAKPSGKTTPVRPKVIEPLDYPWETPGFDPEELPQATIPVPRAVPVIKESAPAEPDLKIAEETSALPSVGTTPGPGRPRTMLTAAALVAALAGIGTSAWLFQERTSALSDLAAARETLASRDQEAAGTAAGAAAVLANSETQGRLELMRSQRDLLTRIARKLNESRPIEAGEPSDRAAMLTWKAVAEQVSGQLEESLTVCSTEPGLASGNLPARWQYTRLAGGLGQNDLALASAEQLSRDLAALAAAPQPTTDADTSDRPLLTARAAAMRGALLMSQEKIMEALPLLQEASAGFEAWLNERMAGDAREVAANYLVSREYAANSLLEGNALQTRGQIDEARLAWERLQNLLPDPAKPGLADPKNAKPEDRILLADALKAHAGTDAAAAEALILAEQDKEAAPRFEAAVDGYSTAIKLLLPYEATHPDSFTCRYRIAECYHNLGQVLSTHGTPRDASVAFGEAIDILTELTSADEDPDIDRYNLLLARSWLNFARLVVKAKQKGPAGEPPLDFAESFAKAATSRLRKLNESSTLNSTYRHYLSEALVFNAGLAQATGDTATALAQYKEAHDQIASLLEDSSLSPADQQNAQRLDADALFGLGGLHEKASRKDEAVAAYRAACAIWESTAPGTPDAQVSYVSVKARLDKLDPDTSAKNP